MDGNHEKPVIVGLLTCLLWSLAIVDSVLAQSEVSFIARRDFRVGFRPQAIIVGDFNGDGHQDLATANNLAVGVSILLGHGDGTFRPAPAVAVGARPRAITVGDFNGDGHQDLATPSNSAQSVSILLGQGDGTFQAVPDVDVGSFPQSITVGDFDSDGRPDLATADSLSNSVSILINNTSSVAVNDFVTFEPIESTFTFTPDPTGCPARFVGVFRFEARLTNTSDQVFANLFVEVATLTHGNFLQNADGAPGGVGARLTVPREDGFTDGVLSPDEFVDMPFLICTTQQRPFTFAVDVLGTVE